MSESEAVSLAQIGDLSAFSFLYDLHRRNVHNRCRQILHNEEEAEDLTQEVFLLLWQKIKLYRGRSSFQTWLYRLTTNKVLAYIRHKKCRPPSGAGDAPERFTLADQHSNLELEEALENLTDMQRFCVEAEMQGNSVRGLGGRNYLKAAQHSLKEALV